MEKQRWRVTHRALCHTLLSASNSVLDQQTVNKDNISNETTNIAQTTITCPIGSPAGLGHESKDLGGPKS